MHAAHASGEYPYRRAGAVIVAATIVWGAGVSPVSRVYITPRAVDRLAMLQRGRRAWVAGQFVTAAGTAAVPIGFAGFAEALPAGPPKKLATAAAAALLAGAPLFVADLADRASDLERFAYRRGPAWRFIGYCTLHVVALASLGTALLTMPGSSGAAREVPASGAAREVPPSGVPTQSTPAPGERARRWIGLTTLLSAPAFAAILVAKKDIPPFVFYLMEQAVGFYLCFHREPEATRAAPL
ncbi:hypothetical protein ACW0JT_09375 [Arthrobacter sp. SA17]